MLCSCYCLEIACAVSAPQTVLHKQAKAAYSVGGMKAKMIFQGRQIRCMTQSETPASTCSSSRADCTPRLSELHTHTHTMSSLRSELFNCCWRLETSHRLEFVCPTLLHQTSALIIYAIRFSVEVSSHALTPEHRATLSRHSIRHKLSNDVRDDDIAARSLAHGRQHGCSAGANRSLASHYAGR